MTDQMQKIVVMALIAELKVQAEGGYNAPYVDADDPADAIIDGHVDLGRLAQAVIEALPKGEWKAP